MGLEHIHAQVDILFVKKECIAKGIEQKTQHRIASATGRITESLEWHPFPEWLVKEINNRRDKVVNHGLFLPGEDNTSGLTSRKQLVNSPQKSYLMADRSQL